MILWNFRLQDLVKKDITIKYRNTNIEIKQMDYEKENFCKSEVLIMTSYQWKIFKADVAIHSYNSNYNTNQSTNELFSFYSKPFQAFFISVKDYKNIF